MRQGGKREFLISLELLVLLEKEYGVTVTDVNAGRKVFGSVRSLAEYVVANKKD